MDALAEANDFAEVINIGKSYEGRDMNVLAITKAGPGAPSVWLEAGIHAREWIAPAVATFIVRELVNFNCRLKLYNKILQSFKEDSFLGTSYVSWKH